MSGTAAFGGLSTKSYGGAVPRCCIASLGDIDRSCGPRGMRLEDSKQPIGNVSKSIRVARSERFLADAYQKLREVCQTARYRARYLTRLPLIRQLRCVQLRRIHPLADGRQQGTAVVRHYWACFLQ